MGILSELFSGFVNLGLFVTFGLPVLIMLIALFCQGFERGNILSFKGRLNRKKFIIYSIIVIVGLALDATIFAFTVTKRFHSSALMIILAFVAISGLVFNWANIVKRLHDMGKSGYWALAYLALSMFMPRNNTFAQLIMLAIQIAFCAIPGEKGPNKFGEDPLENNAYIE